MRKVFLFLSFVLVLKLITVSPVFAKKLLPYLRKTVTTAKTTKTTTGKVKVSVKFRTDRRAIVATLSNLTVANKVDYFLSYNSKGITQGASGTIMNTSQGAISRELLFGSCSKGVCRYDTSITNAKFVVNSYLPNGQKVIKTFRIKI